MKKDFYKEGRLGMVIDGTGDDFSKIKVKKDELEEFGYDTYMIFINTSLEVAQARNARRTRTLPEELVSDIWHAVQDNIGAFQREFGSQNMVIVDNSVDGDVSFSDIEKVLNKLLKKPIQNSIGRKWLKGE
jgi:predicted kinase